MFIWSCSSSLYLSFLFLLVQSYNNLSPSLFYKWWDWNKWMVRIRHMGPKLVFKCGCLRGNPFSFLLPLCSPATLRCFWGHKGGWLMELIQKICKPPQVSISASLAPGSVRSDLSQQKQKQLVGELGGSRAALLPAVSWLISFAITWNLTLIQNLASDSYDFIQRMSHLTAERAAGVQCFWKDRLRV